MQKYIGLAILLVILGSAVCTPPTSAGPIRKVIMAKKMQQKQEQKQQQTQSGSAGTSSNAKSGTTGMTGTTGTNSK